MDIAQSINSWLCNYCGALPDRPVFFPACGHSPCCEACVTQHKPKRCPECQEPNKTPAKRLKRNKTLETVLRLTFPEHYNHRPQKEATAEELQRQETVEKLHTGIRQHATELPPKYTEEAMRIIDVQHKQGGKTDLIKWCHCGLLCIPRKSRKGRFFYGCSRWKPNSDTDSCKTFKWLSESQAKCLND